MNTLINLLDAANTGGNPNFFDLVRAADSVQSSPELSASDYIIAGLSSLSTFAATTVIGGRLMIPFNFAGESDRTDRYELIASSEHEAQRRRRIYSIAGAIALVPSAAVYAGYIGDLTI